jgi:hypothetical protein
LLARFYTAAKTTDKAPVVFDLTGSIPMRQWLAKIEFLADNQDQ